MSRVKRTVTAPPEPAAAARIRAPSRSEIVPPGSPEKNAKVGSPGRFSATTIPVAPASLARAAFAAYGQPPRLTSAIAPRSEPAGAASQSWRLTPAIGADVDEPLVRRDPRRRDVVRRSERDPRRRPLGETTDSDGPKTWAFATAPTLIASGAVAGDPAVPRPKKSRSFPAEMIGHDARAHDVRDRLDEDVRARIGLRAAAREVDDVHAVAHRRLEGGDDLGAVRRAAAAERSRCGNVEDAVVPDVGARRDALDALHRGMAAPRRLDAEPGPPGLDVRLDAGDDAGDERPVERLVAVERRAARPGPGEAARRRSPSASSRPTIPFGKPGGYENPAGSRNGCSWSTPSSTTATLTPSPLAPVSDENAGAPSTDGPRFRSRWYVRLG